MCEMLISASEHIIIYSVVWYVFTEARKKTGKNAKWLIHYRAFIEAAVLRSDTYESLKLSPALFRVQA